MLINTAAVFSFLEERRAKAEVILRDYSAEEQAEASRVALIYDRCALTSIKHLEDTAYHAVLIYGKR